MSTETKPNYDHLRCGICDVCKEPFEYGQEGVRVTAFSCGSSQGYGTKWEGKTVEAHTQCLSKLDIKTLEILSRARI